MNPGNKNTNDVPQAQPADGANQVPSMQVYSSGNMQTGDTNMLSINSAQVLRKEVPRFWKILSVVLAIFSFGPIILYILAIVLLASVGAPGAEFIALGITPLLLVSILSFSITFVSAIVFIIRYKPTGKRLILPIIAIVTAVLVVASLVLGFMSLRNRITELSTRHEANNSISNSAAVEKIQNCEVESLIIRYKGGSYPALLNIKNQDENMYVRKGDLVNIQRSISSNSQKCGRVRTLHENDNGDISVVGAISFDDVKNLLSSCKIEQVRMPMDEKYLTKTEKEALGETGFYSMEDFAGMPFAIGFNESTRSMVTPIARQASSQCKGMKFMLSPGHWASSI